MVNLRDLRSRVRGVRATQKIISAMKMVSAAKLRRAEANAKAARFYAQHIPVFLSNALAHGYERIGELPLLLRPAPATLPHLVIIYTANQGLCGGFNASLAKAARTHVAALSYYHILCQGRKGADLLRRAYGHTFISKPDHQSLVHFIQEGLRAEQFGTVTLIYSYYISPLRQEIKIQQVVPFIPEPVVPLDGLYELEPSVDEVLVSLALQNLEAQLNQAVLETAASEQGARMNAMDHASRNADDVLKHLRITYNRQRQAAITKELTEIIASAETLK